MADAVTPIDSKESLPSLPAESSKHISVDGGNLSPAAQGRSPMASGEYSSALASFEGALASEHSGRQSPGYHSSMESPSFRSKRVQGGIGSNFIKAKQVDEMSNHSSYAGKVRASAVRFLQSTHFANFMAVVVLVDASSLIVDIDSRAVGEAPPRVLMLMSDLCLALYTAELVMQVILRGCHILSHWLVAIDAMIIGCGYAELVLNALLTSETLQTISFFSMLRVLRLARILRLVRLLRKAPRLRELQKLVTMMATCLKALVWSFVFCFVIMTVWAMLLVEIVGPLIQTLMEDPEHELWVRCGEECKLLTTSVMRANVLLFKTVIAGDSWGLIAVPVIMEYPATAIIFMGSLLTLVFGVLNLIVAVVVDTFAEARERDVLNLAEEMERNHENDKKFLQKVFERIDEDGSGELTLEELVEGARKDQEFQSRLRVMDIDEVDLQQLFEMIDVDGSGAIEAQEFIAPLSRWVHDSKTAPRFIKYNMLRTMQQQEEMYRQSQFHFNALATRIEDLYQAIHQGRQAQLDPETVEAVPSSELVAEEQPDPEPRDRKMSMMSQVTEPLEPLERHESARHLPEIAEGPEQPQASLQADLRKTMSRKPPQPLRLGHVTPSKDSTTDGGLHGHSPANSHHSDTALKNALESLEQSLLIATEGALRRSMSYVEIALQQTLGQAIASASHFPTAPSKFKDRRRSVFATSRESRRGSFDDNPFLGPGSWRGRKGSFEENPFMSPTRPASSGPSRLGSFDIMRMPDESHGVGVHAVGKSEPVKRAGIPAKAIKNASTSAPDSPPSTPAPDSPENTMRELPAPTSRRRARHSVAGFHFNMGQVVKP